MTLEEIKSKICDLRFSVEELQEEAQNLWRETDDKRIENVAIYLDNELGYIAYRLSDLEDIKTDTEENADTDGIEEGLDEWYFDLSYNDRARLCGISTPGNGRDDLCEFLDHTEKWWNAKTIAQKQQEYADFNLGY